jgi:hypothetical protein
MPVVEAEEEGYHVRPDTESAPSFSVNVYSFAMHESDCCEEVQSVVEEVHSVVMEGFL